MVGKDELGQRRRVGLGPRGGLGHPAGLGAGDGEGLLVDRARHLADAGDGADRRDVLHGAVDGALDLVGHQIAAVGVGADRERLGLQIAQRRRPRRCGRRRRRRPCAGGRRRSGARGPPRCGRADFRASSSTTRLCSSSARLMRSTLSVVTTSADMRRSSWPRRSSLPSLKASKARMKPSKAVAEVVGVGGFGFDGCAWACPLSMRLTLSWPGFASARCDAGTAERPLQRSELLGPGLARRDESG